MRNRPLRLRYLVVFVLGLLCCHVASAQDLPRVMVFPTVNQTGAADYEPVCAASEHTLGLAFASLKTCTVLDRTVIAREWAQPGSAFEADYLVLSSLVLLPESRLGLSVLVLSTETQEIVLKKQTPSVTLMDVFAAIDDLAADMVSTLSRKQGTFGIFEVVQVPEPTPEPRAEPAAKLVPTADSMAPSPVPTVQAIVENAPRKLCPDGINGELMYVPYPVSITLDGKLDDWEGISFHTAENCLSNTFGNVVKGENESISLALAADETYMYVACTVVDRIIIAGRHGLDYYKEDSAELYLAYGSGLNAATYTKNNHFLTISPKFLGLPWLVPVMENGSKVDLGIEMIELKTDHGWGYEARFPLAKKIELRDGFEWGLNFQLNGASDGNGRVVKIGWSSKDRYDEAWQKPSVWGKAVMYKVRDEAVVPAAAPAARVADLLPTDGLVGEWLFDGNTFDGVGNFPAFTSNSEKSGAIRPRNSGPDRFGRADSAFAFPYAPNEQSIFSIKGDNTLSGDFTVSVWVKLDDKSLLENGRIFNAMNNPTVSGFTLCVEKEAGVVVCFYAKTGKMQKILTGIRDSFSWHNITINCSDGHLGVSVNGFLRQNSRETVSLPSQNWSVGNGFDGWRNCPFSGSIDDLRVYNRNLSFDEIRSLYWATVP